MSEIIIDTATSEVVLAGESHEIVLDRTVSTLEVSAPAHDMVIEVPGLPGPEGPQGPQGPDGEPGIPGEGPSWWFGSGEPTNIPGSKPGDRYLDEDSGLVYTLGDTESTFAANLKIGA